MSLFGKTPTHQRHVGLGLLAGALAGLMGAFVKWGWEVPFPPRAADRIPEPGILISYFTDHSFGYIGHAVSNGWVGAGQTAVVTSVAIMIVHTLFTVASGAIYGVAAEYFPIVRWGMGAAFGIVVLLFCHEFLMPLIGLTPAPWNLPWGEQASEFFGHILWGVGIEIVYADLRRRFLARKSRLDAPAAAAEKAAVPAHA